MNNVVPLAKSRELAVRERRAQELEVALQPAKASEVQKLVATLSASVAFMPSLLDPAAFSAALAQFLTEGNYPPDVLHELYKRVVGRGGFKHMPSIAELIAIADEIVAPRKAALEAVRAEQEQEERRQRFVAAMHERLVGHVGEAAPTLDDVDCALREVPGLGRYSGLVSWVEFTDKNPPACAELVNGLAAIARSETNEEAKDQATHQLLNSADWQEHATARRKHDQIVAAMESLKALILKRRDRLEALNAFLTRRWADEVASGGTADEQLEKCMMLVSRAMQLNHQNKWDELTQTEHEALDVIEQQANEVAGAPGIATRR